MFKFFIDLHQTLLESNVSPGLLYVIYGLLAILVVLSVFLISFVGKKLFETSNYTMRKLLLLRHNTSSGKIKKIGKKSYFAPTDDMTLLKRIYLNNKLALEKGGFYSKRALVVIIVAKWVAIPIFSFLIYLANLNIEGQNATATGVFSFFFFEGFAWMFVRWQIKREADKFKIASYKLFKFLRNQLSAGIKITQALNSLHTVATDPLLKNRLLLMASHYASTSDIDEALKYITNYYQTLEAKSLALSIKQSIETGQNDKGFVQKEKKLFNMYLNVIKRNTQLIMVKYFLIGLLYGAVIILIISYPQWLDLIQANKLLFGN